MSFSTSHRLYVKSLYKRYLTQGLDWLIRRDLWRPYALEVRAKFEANRHVRDPRRLAAILDEAERRLAERAHPDPYRPAQFPGGTKWERNIPPRLFTAEEKRAAREATHV